MLAINDTTTTVMPPTDTASLSWTLRASQSGPANVQIFYYFAIALTPLSADSVTFALSSNKVATICQDFAISGADTDHPFDPHSGVPNTNSGDSTINSVTYDTSNPNDFLIILQGFCAQGPAGSGSPTGFATIVDAQYAHSTSSNCAANSLQTNTNYKIVSATQSSNTVLWAFDTQNSPFAVIGDAIQSTPGPLTASVNLGSNFVDVGQLASFLCIGGGGLFPYTYSWTFGDGSSGSGASSNHIYRTPGTMTVVCTVADILGTTAIDSAEVSVIMDPSIIAFTATPASLFPGDKVTFTVSASGGHGSLWYSYLNLPGDCLSTNTTSFSCYPASSGDYLVTVRVTDRAGESANATVAITVGPQRVLGLPRAVGLAVVFGTILGISAAAILSVALALRRKKRRQAFDHNMSPSSKPPPPIFRA